MIRRFMNSNKAFFLLSLMILLIATIKGQQYACSDTTYDLNSPFQTNLNRLLSSLSSNSNRSDGFYNTTVGQNNPNATVYGLFLCLGDATVPTCQQCVSDATKHILQKCPNNTGAVVWEDKCWLHYSDQYFFSTAQVSPMRIAYNTGNASNPSSFMKLVGDTMRAVRDKAASGSSKKFATKEEKFNDLQTLYTLVQCTPDINELDCRSCVEQSLGAMYNTFNGKQGGVVLTPSCYTRYELYPFYRNVTSPPTPTLEPISKDRSKIKAGTIIAIVVPTVILILLVSFCFTCQKKRGGKKNKYSSVPKQTAVDISSVESLQFDLDTIKTATDNFSPDNRLGQGGFGEVYKGILPGLQEIAVKRLSSTSKQGVEQFKNEVATMAKLQHKNLVRLLGFCLVEEEKILIYEFVPNKSLDNFLFEPENREKLDWSKCYKIVEGIAKGMLYLHEDSRLKIIHRDLKASNVLLDEDLNPKISDFGMARIFGIDQTQANTSRVVGTFGYMAPEYAMHGKISVKSDIYSFGVLILEIISGKKNTSFYVSNYAQDLLSYAWNLWREGRPLELLDPSLRDSYSRNEVMKCIHISFLCVQEDPALRPTIQSVMVMLSSDSVTLSDPQEPAFFIDHWRTDSNNPVIDGNKSDQSTSRSVQLSVDEDPITDLSTR